MDNINLDNINLNYVGKYFSSEHFVYKCVGITVQLDDDSPVVGYWIKPAGIIKPVLDIETDVQVLDPYGPPRRATECQLARFAMSSEPPEMKIKF